MPWPMGWIWWNPVIQHLSRLGYLYLGPCKSGLGPWAFFLTPSGQVVHISQSIPYYQYNIFWPFFSTEQELVVLERQKELIEDRISQLKRRLKEIRGDNEK